MSSEIPLALYAEVDKSREDRAEPGESYMEIDEDVGPPQLPAKKKKRKQPPSISPYKGKALKNKSADRNDVQNIDLQAGNVGASCSTTTLDSFAFLPVKDDKPSKRVSKYCIMLLLAVIITTLMIAITLTVSVISVTANYKVESDIAALHSELFVLQQSQCNSRSNDSYLDDDFEELYQLRQNFTQLLWDFQQLRSQLLDQCPSFTPSCSSLHPDCPSDYYQVRASNGSAVRVYCDMTLSCGGVTGGWMRVAELNMTDTSQQCPGELMEINNDSLRRCETMNKGCSPITYPTHNSYTKVCGRITAYQVGTTNAFRRYIISHSDINSTYVDGVSLTHGNPREHIWTFAAALDRNDNVTGERNNHCPCRFKENPFEPPPFVGEDYFCDAGNVEFMTGEIGLQTNPLWDGTDCLCCVSDNPPWFYKQLSQSTTDDIEMRVCRDEINEENIGIQEIEIYVQ